MRLLLSLLLLAGVANAETQPYVAKQLREIASLSSSDVEALLAGEGWGLALPAELNGYPGPAHILEFADELSLTEDQRTQVQSIFDHMLEEAKELGGQYVDVEAHLSQMFRSGHADPAVLAELLQDSANLLASLRAVHLAAHIEATPLLTEAQRNTYADLRGYAGGQEHEGHGTGHGNH